MTEMESPLSVTPKPKFCQWVCPCRLQLYVIVVVFIVVMYKLHERRVWFYRDENNMPVQQDSCSDSFLTLLQNKFHISIISQQSFITPFSKMTNHVWPYLVPGRWLTVGRRQTFAVKQSYSQLTLNQHIASIILNCLQNSKQTCRGKKNSKACWKSTRTTSSKQKALDWCTVCFLTEVSPEQCVPHCANLLLAAVGICLFPLQFTLLALLCLCHLLFFFPLS